MCSKRTVLYTFVEEVSNYSPTCSKGTVLYTFVEEVSNYSPMCSKAAVLSERNGDVMTLGDSIFRLLIASKVRANAGHSGRVIP